MQAQLQELESKILAHMAEMQGKSAREAVASLGLRLQKEGVIGVTEEVRDYAPRPLTTHTHCQLPGVFRDPSAMQEAPVFALGLVREGGGSPARVACVPGDQHGASTERVSLWVPGPQQWRHGGHNCSGACVVGGAPHREPGPEALQRGPHRDGGLRVGVWRCVRRSPSAALVPARALGVCGAAAVLGKQGSQQMRATAPRSRDCRAPSSAGTRLFTAALWSGSGVGWAWGICPLCSERTWAIVVPLRLPQSFKPGVLLAAERSWLSGLPPLRCPGPRHPHCLSLLCQGPV